MLLTKSLLPPHGIWLSHPFSIVQEIMCKIKNFCVGNLSCKCKQIIECWKLLVHKNNATQEKIKDAICHFLFSNLDLASQMDFIVHMIQLQNI
jgi:hypothetical protein